jgi:hypothetical protein
MSPSLNRTLPADRQTEPGAERERERERKREEGRGRERKKEREREGEKKKINKNEKNSPKRTNYRMRLQQPTTKRSTTTQLQLSLQQSQNLNYCGHGAALGGWHQTPTTLHLTQQKRKVKNEMTMEHMTKTERWDANYGKLTGSNPGNYVRKATGGRTTTTKYSGKATPNQRTHGKELRISWTQLPPAGGRN